MFSGLSVISQIPAQLVVQSEGLTAFMENLIEKHRLIVAVLMN